MATPDRLLFMQVDSIFFFFFCYVKIYSESLSSPFPLCLECFPDSFSHSHTHDVGVPLPLLQPVHSILCWLNMIGWHGSEQWQENIFCFPEIPIQLLQATETNLSLNLTLSLSDTHTHTHINTHSGGFPQVRGTISFVSSLVINCARIAPGVTWGVTLWAFLRLMMKQTVLTNFLTPSHQAFTLYSQTIIISIVPRLPGHVGFRGKGQPWFDCVGM